MPLGSVLRRPSVLLILALCAVGVVVTVLGRLAGGPRGNEKRVRLSTEGGSESWPAVSPDGKRVAYSRRESRDGATFHIFVRPAGGGSARQLTSGDASDIGPAWSPDGGSIAFLRAGGGASGECMTVSAAGGAEHKVTDCASAADAGQTLPGVAWMRDGKSLVVAAAGGKDASPALFLAPLAGGAPRRLTNPPEGSAGDSTPAVSPRGDHIAFVRASGGEGADIYLCNSGGGDAQRLTFDDRRIRGLSWTPNGRELVYAAERSGQGWELWRLPASGGSPRAILAAGRRAQYPAVALAGNLLVYTDTPSLMAIWRVKPGPRPDSPAEERPLIRSSGREFGAAWSPDGKRIADISDQTGNDEIWISDAEGGNRAQVTAMKGPRLWPPRWSPDEQKLLFEARGDDGPELYTVPADVSRPVQPVRVALAGGASWSADGKSIYYQSRGAIWKANADGGNPQHIEAQPGADFPVESPDGKYVYYAVRGHVWRTAAAGGGDPEEVIGEGHRVMFAAMEPAKAGLYFTDMEFGGHGPRMTISLFDYATRNTRAVFRLERAEFWPRSSFSVSPDGKTILYSRVDQNETDLMLLQNFR